MCHAAICPRKSLISTSGCKFPSLRKNIYPPGRRFAPPDNVFGTPEENPYNSCFCASGNCAPSGLFNISSCQFGYLYTIYTVSAQSLHSICTVSTQYLYTIYKVSTQYLHISTQVPADDVVAPLLPGGPPAAAGCGGAPA